MQTETRTLLPEADADSQAHSQHVVAHLRTLIERAGGQISFARFMHEALYAPGLGYYAAGAVKFGAHGDFVTAPEVSSVFGRVLARQCVEVLQELEAGEVLELGAGSGKLALDMLQAFEQCGAMPAAYSILEVSADLRERQELLLCDKVPHLMSRVRWLTDLPSDFSGVVIANEVLDALPVERFVKSGSEVLQACVSCGERGFFWSTRTAPDQLRLAVEAIEADLEQPLADGFTSEVALAAPAWITDVGSALREGVMFLFDYGVSRREYYAPDRVDGWLRCHYRHQVHSDPFIHVGIQDLTAWVDFSAVAAAAVSSELDIHGYQSQAQFLLGGGLDIEMQSFEDLSLQQQLELSAQIKTLTLPGEMGENFKCMALGRGNVVTPSTFHVADRTQTL